MNSSDTTAPPGPSFPVDPLLKCAKCNTENLEGARFCSNCGTPTRPSMSRAPEGDGSMKDPLVGQTIADRYRIVSLLGRGGMGVVYKAEHVHIGRLVAVKLLHGELARDRDTIKRFTREAEAAARLEHPNTAQVFDFGRDEGLMYLVMEYIDGRDLGYIVQHEGPLAVTRVLKLTTQICACVGQAHIAGIVHRDIKPENIMVVDGKSREIAKVLDFGLAKLRHHDSGMSLTQAGAIIGTPYYMAPEHIRGDEVDHRADIYSLGALMYKTITGVPPFWASSPMGVLTKHLTDPVIPPSERMVARNIPPEVDEIVLRAMEKNPNVRYQSMEELSADITSYLSIMGEPSASSSPSLPSGASLLTPSGKRKVVKVATRNELDVYEKRIRRRGLYGRALAVLAVIGALLGGYFIYQNRPEPADPTVEAEPNNDPDSANPLLRGVPKDGRIAQRISETAGDRDVYRISNPGGARRVVAFEVSGLPNMDLVVDVVRAGVERAVLTANSGGRGEPELVPNFPLVGSIYYLRVRETDLRTGVPTENLSDSYTVSWDFVEPSEQDEHEINDSLELAEEIGLGTERRGFIGWAGDVDTYCMSTPANLIEARLSAVPELDLVLTAVNRSNHTSRKFNGHGIGEAESTEAIADAEAGSTCFEVSVDPQEGRRSNPETGYSLTVRNQAEEGSGT